MTDLFLIAQMEWIYEKERESWGDAHDKLYWSWAIYGTSFKHQKNNPKYLINGDFYKAFLRSSCS